MPSSRESADHRRLWRPIALGLGLLLGARPGVARAEPPTEPAPPAASQTAPEGSDSPPILAYVVGAIGLSGI